MHSRPPSPSPPMAVERRYLGDTKAQAGHGTSLHKSQSMAPNAVGAMRQKIGHTAPCGFPAKLVDQVLCTVAQAPGQTNRDKDDPSYPPPLPIAQARPWDQKTRQNSGSTPTLCLDKTMLARDTHNVLVTALG